jgi:hypothetical protein
MCMSKAVKPYFEKTKLFGMITESCWTFSPKLSNIYVTLGKIHHHLDVMFTSLEKFVRRQTVKLKRVLSEDIPTPWFLCNIYSDLNNWVMHPVARVSIKYWNNLRTQHSIFLVLDFIVHNKIYVRRSSNIWLIYSDVRSNAESDFHSPTTQWTTSHLKSTYISWLH